MRIATAIVILILGSMLSQGVSAQPDRESLISAWETHVETLPGAVRLEKTGDGVYEYVDSDLPYEGELKITGALVRSAEMSGYETEFTHLGMVDFELVDLPVERMSSQVFYYWRADRQTLHYSDSEQRWMNVAEYQSSFSEMYDTSPSFGVLSFMLNYGIWVLLVALLVFVFVSFNRQAKKARTLMDDTASINKMARENLDRAQGMQDEVLAIARETRDLQADNTRILKQMLEALQR